MDRRGFLRAGGATLATLAAPSIVRAAGATTVRFVPYIDLPLLDPVINTATPTRNHGFMVFDTLYGFDRSFTAQPQMVAGHVVEDDGKRWTLTLRDGLRFHDGTPVLARDAVASVKRWGTRDNFGRTLMEATDELSAPDDKRIVFRLKHPFPLLPDALAKMVPSMCAIMPARLATTDPFKPVPEVIGSGPFRYVANERVPGARNVYAKFEGYVPRPDGTPGLTSGPKIVRVDRVEWQTIPDPATAASAIRTGEVDWVETPSPDLVPTLRREPALVVAVNDPNGVTPILRFNCTQAPFDNVAIRRALLGAADQTSFMQAYSGDPRNWHVKLGVFTPNTPMATEAGMEHLFGPVDVSASQKALKDAGYKGERIVVLTPTDHPVSTPVTQVAIDIWKRIGINVDSQAMDSGTMFQRRNNRGSADAGGWHMFPSMMAGIDMLSPATAELIRGDGAKAWYGWPTSPALETLHDAWLAASDEAGRKRVCEQIQLQVWQDATYIPAGQIFLPIARSKKLDNLLPGFPKFWNLTKSA